MAMSRITRIILNSRTCKEATRFHQAQGSDFRFASAQWSESWRLAPVDARSA
jgi:hypothetical protein